MDFLSQNRQAGASRNASEYTSIVGLLHSDVCVYAAGADYADLVWRSPPIDQATLDAEIDAFNLLLEKVDITPEMIATGANVLAGMDRRFEDIEDVAEDIYRAMAAVKARNGERRAA